MGGLPESFGFPEGLNGAEFNEVLAEFLDLIDEAWIMSVGRPVGLALGVRFGPFTLPGDFTWFPWATNRNRLEGIVSLINTVRRDHHLLSWVKPEEAHLWVHVARYGIIRRVGTVHPGDERLPLWESKNA